MEGSATCSIGNSGAVGAGGPVGSAGEVVFGVELDVGGTGAGEDTAGAGSDGADTTFEVAEDADGVADSCIEVGAGLASGAGSAAQLTPNIIVAVTTKIISGKVEKDGVFPEFIDTLIIFPSLC